MDQWPRGAPHTKENLVHKDINSEELNLVSANEIFKNFRRLCGRHFPDKSIKPVNMQHWFCKNATFRSHILNTFAHYSSNLFVGSVLVKKTILPDL